jgi:hypothetical protein
MPWCGVVSNSNSHAQKQRSKDNCADDLTAMQVHTVLPAGSHIPHGVHMPCHVGSGSAQQCCEGCMPYFMMCTALLCTRLAIAQLSSDMHCNRLCTSAVAANAVPCRAVLLLPGCWCRRAL